MFCFVPMFAEKTLDLWLDDLFEGMDGLWAFIDGS